MPALTGTHTQKENLGSATLPSSIKEKGTHTQRIPSLPHSNSCYKTFPFILQPAISLCNMLQALVHLQAGAALLRRCRPSTWLMPWPLPSAQSLPTCLPAGEHTLARVHTGCSQAFVSCHAHKRCCFVLLLGANIFRQGQAEKKVISR